MSETLYTPRISEVTKKIIEKKNQVAGSSTVYQRLYDLNKEKLHKQLNNLADKKEENENGFASTKGFNKTGIKSNDKIEEKQVIQSINIFRKCLNQKFKNVLKI